LLLLWWTCQQDESIAIAINGPQAGVSFLLIKLTHFKVNTQKITLAWCYISVVAILFY